MHLWLVCWRTEVTDYWEFMAAAATRGQAEKLVMKLRTTETMASMTGRHMCRAFQFEEVPFLVTPVPAPPLEPWPSGSPPVPSNAKLA